MMYKIQQIAQIAGVSMRTLRYYDQIGLLVPSKRTEAGYRLYDDQNIVTLQQIMLKELGFSLNSIKELGTENALLRKDVLTAQKNVLIKKQARLNEIIIMITAMIDERKESDPMNKEEMFSAFDMSDIEHAQKQYAHEVNRKYPKHLVDESNAKTSGYTKQDWARITHRQDDINTQIASHLKNGIAPSDKIVQNLVTQFQCHISKNFYTCDNKCLKDLGDMYVSDERFTTYYDKIAPGLAQYIQKAIHIYCNI